MVLNAQAFEHRALPEATTTEKRSRGVYDAECQDALNWAGDDSEGKGMSMILIPGLDIKCQGGYSYQYKILPRASANTRDNTHKQKVSGPSSSPVPDSLSQRREALLK